MNRGSDSMASRFDCLVIGYGPAGATLAKLLGQRGYRVAVVESAPAIYDKPRAITADQEAMRVFQQCGLADEIAAATCPHPGTDFVGLRGQVIKRFYPQPPPHQLAWEPTWMFVQPELEAALRRGVARHSNVQVFLEHEFLSLDQDNAGVQVQVRDLADARTVTLRARYVIACDGARSPVRRQLKGTVEDLAFDEWWIVADAHLRGQPDLPPRCVQYCRPSRPGTYIVGPGTLRRWEIKMLPGEAPSDFAGEDAIRRVLGEFTDVDAVTLWRSAVYRFHALVARQWRFGRVFLMGDAAHQMPPFLGQGLCAAIRDTVNLAWKLDAVERLGASPALLDTYGEERTPHVRTIVSHAKSFGLIIGELDEAAARERDARLEQELQSGHAQTVRQKFIPGLEAGFIDLDDKGAPGPGAGMLAVQPWVQAADGGGFRRLDDLVKPGFVLLTRDANAIGWLDEDSSRFWQRLGGQWVLFGNAFGSAFGSTFGNADSARAMDADLVRVRERDTVLSDWMDASVANVVLVRPDRYVYGIASDRSDLQRLLRRVEQAFV